MATTPAGYADIWRYLFDIDLVATVEAWNRPSDDPLLVLVREPRRLRFGVCDGLWVRLIDIPAALEARRYSSDDRVVFDVTDVFRPGNDGRYELIVEEGTGRCTRTDAEPDLAGSVNVLGATYLGGRASVSRPGRDWWRNGARGASAASTRCSRPRPRRGPRGPSDGSGPPSGSWVRPRPPAGGQGRTPDRSAG